MCAIRPSVATRAGVCLIMADIEPLKPTNTGWLVADVVADTFAFGWARTEVDPALLALLNDPQWQPYVVFSGAVRRAGAGGAGRRAAGIARGRSREAPALHPVRRDLGRGAQDVPQEPLSRPASGAQPPPRADHSIQAAQLGAATTTSAPARWRRCA
ncbi:DTW domain-containing protein [Ditylenchus destructor]|uniref:tRNA-uridine aminocarboxypropyltransferase n=1 Tax=Ditylenchus destructor TaxID=166010 RepID=A0AAD4MFB4_9BILA|nr:DTW domain-containing protein [Ditylenchus destructor]